ncbi:MULTISPECIES: hypothetical protein [unclassified Frankia]|uniref:arsenate reductase/protein-tyrosine-phosphatase family protein n=1 Tax=Frankia TaxID=1854 RepID=UPI0009E3090E
MITVLHVCEGNICRSPFAEIVSSDILSSQVPGGTETFYIHSAGTRAVVGGKLHSVAEVELERRGVLSGDFRARQISSKMVTESHLVLTATTHIRDDLLTAAPWKLGRIFTWLELAWLAEGLDWNDIPGRSAAERVIAMPAVAERGRGYLSPRPSASFDIRDPLRMSKRAAGREFRKMETALETVFALL